MPFRYGIATMVDVPHVFLRLHLETPAGRSVGISADHLPPKWFTKDPERDPLDEIDEMLEVLRHAIDSGERTRGRFPVRLLVGSLPRSSRLGPDPRISLRLSPISASPWSSAPWWTPGAAGRGYALPPGRPGESPRDRPRSYPQKLTGRNPGESPARPPPETVHARHTVGLSDPLRESDIPAGERLSDGLPQSLEASIRFYGLTHFKIKVQGDPDRDIPRLRTSPEVLDEIAASPDYRRLPGRKRELSTEASLCRLLERTSSRPGQLDRLLETCSLLSNPCTGTSPCRHRYPGACPDPTGSPCPIIIDESDAESIQSSTGPGTRLFRHQPQELQRRLQRHRQSLPDQLAVQEGLPHLMMSGEDLSNVGPIALLQDLAVQSTLGIESVERNGHHYFTGLSAYPESLQNRVLDAHGDLYIREGDGVARVDITDGRMSTRSTVDTPFGVGFQPDLDQFANQI